LRKLPPIEKSKGLDVATLMNQFMDDHPHSHFVI